MKRHRLLVLVGLAVASSTGCGGKQSLSSPGGIGGAAGHKSGGPGAPGGQSGFGAADSGAVVYLDGGGAVLDARTGGVETTCVGADGGLMRPPLGGSPDAGAGDGGVCATLPADPPAFPWTIEPQLGAVSAGGDGSLASGCRATTVSGQVVDVVCSGAAWLRPNGGTGGSGGAVPSVTWDDGSRLSWEPAGLDPSIPAPIAPGAADQRVWADLESHGWLAVPGACGWSWDQTMTLRDADGGRIRFMAREGAGEPEPSAADLGALFGVSTDAVTWCTHDVVGGPALFHQTLHEHVLATNPPQVIPYGQATEVTTPNGNFAVLWYARSQVAYPLSATCAGCLNQGPDVGFVASPL